MRSGEPIGGEIVKLWFLRLLPKLPNDDLEELRLCNESGVGLEETRGDLVAVLAGDLVPERGGAVDTA